MQILFSISVSPRELKQRHHADEENNPSGGHCAQRGGQNVSSSEYEIEPCISAVQTNNGLGCRYYYYYYIIGAIHLQCFCGIYIHHNIYYNDNTPRIRFIGTRSSYYFVLIHILQFCVSVCVCLCDVHANDVYIF